MAPFSRYACIVQPTKPSMARITKKQVLADFRQTWQEQVAVHSSLRGDAVAKREEFNNYVDSLNKSGVVSDAQASNWSNPF
jgi:hypothetical protein